MRLQIVQSAGVFGLLLLGLIAPQWLRAQQPCGIVYASPTGNALADGSATAPVDLNTALTQACGVPARRHIRLLGGTYNLTNKIIFNCNDIVMDGGWEVVAGIGRKSSNVVTTININSPLETSAFDGAAGTTVGYHIGVQAIGRTGFRILDITFNVKNGGAAGTVTGQTGNRGNSVYGFYFRNSTGWTVERCAMNTGAASQGAAGVNGANGANGFAGGGALPAVAIPSLARVLVAAVAQVLVLAQGFAPVAMAVRVAKVGIMVVLQEQPQVRMVWLVVAVLLVEQPAVRQVQAAAAVRTVIATGVVAKMGLMV